MLSFSRMPLESVSKRALAAQARGERMADTERNVEMLRLSDEGHSYADLAYRFGVSRARAHQIVSRERGRRKPKAKRRR